MTLQELFKMPQPWDVEIQSRGAYDADIYINGQLLEKVVRIELTREWDNLAVLRFGVLADWDPSTRIIIEMPFTGEVKGRIERC